uniref:Uncharacterized protein n=1 Tax=Oryza brachyantha TaxID=4533 RepID=J3KWE9_ORYBR
MAVGLLIYRPPHGVLFEHHALAYYMALAFIFAAGAVEVWTAFWLAEEEDDDHHHHGRRRAFGRAVLCVSVIPLAAGVGLGGYAVLV